MLAPIAFFKALFVKLQEIGIIIPIVGVISLWFLKEKNAEMNNNTIKLIEDLVMKIYLFFYFSVHLHTRLIVIFF